ncbi:MAG: hypothetical protein H7301_00430 [Cryobacterium sp.]|nr:hypothetical protein [Oligoflexia bacterium]
MTNFLIGSAYVAISVTLLVLIRQIKLQFSSVILCFGVFILACGLTHFMEIYTLWHPEYWIAVGIMAVTAGASVVTGIYFYQLRILIVTLAEAVKRSEERRLQLEELNKFLVDQQRILVHSAKMSALGEMAGGIVHEINSPL